MSADQLLCKLRADLINKRFCRGINKPRAFVKVLNVYRAGRGFKVMFRYGDDEFNSLVSHSYGILDKIADDCDTTNQQFESLSNHKHHFINGTCVECLKSE